MRGEQEPQVTMLAFIDLETRIPQDHPLRTIRRFADEALASVAFTQAEEGETTVTADLKVDFLRPAKPGRLVARATVRHRTKRLAFCETTVEQADGQIIAEARAVIAYVNA